MKMLKNSNRQKLLYLNRLLRTKDVLLNSRRIWSKQALQVLI
nr:MAG TPA: hypothetical protein [Crassvirales sp.]